MRSQDLASAEEAGILLNQRGDLPAACAVQCCGRPFGTNYEVHGGGGGGGGRGGGGGGGGAREPITGIV